MKCQVGLEVAGVNLGSARSHKWAARLRSIGIRRFEMVARRLAGYAVAMEIARRPERPEVNGDLRKTVSRRSLAPSRELKRKGYRFLGMREMYTRRLTLLRSLSES